MGQITVNDLIRSDGTFDYQRYCTATDNWSNYGKCQFADIDLFQKAEETKSAEKSYLNIEDTITISEQGMKKLKEMQENRVDNSKKECINPFKYEMIGINVTTYIATLASQRDKIIQASSEANHLKNKNSVLPDAYETLRDQIEKTYADSENKPRIVVDHGGKTAHLMTKEEEVSILDEAYKKMTEMYTFTVSNRAY